MKKEVFIAVILGLGIGLFITYGFYRARTALVPTTKPTDLSGTPLPSGIQAESTLIINAPEDESLTTDKQVTIAGTTEPNSFVVVLVGESDTITTADETGNFTVKDTLKEGGNGITITSISEDGTQTQAKRSVILATGIYALETETSTSSASPSPKAK